LNFIWEFSYHFVRKSLCLVVVLIFIVGGMSVYDIVEGDGRIPEPKMLGIRSEIRQKVHDNTTRFDKPQTPEVYWENLQPTLVILKEISPQAEKWVREKHKKGKIRYDASTSFYAKYDFISDELIIYSSMYQEEDGIKATFLAHEWRHSKQNWYKFAKLVLSYAITRELHTELVENDAYLYEAQCRESLYGY